MKVCFEKFLIILPKVCLVYEICRFSSPCIIGDFIYLYILLYLWEEWEDIIEGLIISEKVYVIERLSGFPMDFSDFLEILIIKITRKLFNFHADRYKLKGLDVSFS